MKKITTEQINQVLQSVYQTNIPAKSFDALKDFFAALPEDKGVTIDKKTNEPTTPA